MPHDDYLDGATMLRWLDRWINHGEDERTRPINWRRFHLAAAIVRVTADLLDLAADDLSVREYLMRMLDSAPHGCFVRKRAMQVVQYLKTYRYRGFLQLDCRDAADFMRDYSAYLLEPSENAKRKKENAEEPSEIEMELPYFPLMQRRLLGILKGKGMMDERKVIDALYTDEQGDKPLFALRANLRKLQHDTNAALTRWDINSQIKRPARRVLELMEY
jgi:hypothetical protein